MIPSTEGTPEKTATRKQERRESLESKPRIGQSRTNDRLWGIDCRKNTAVTSGETIN